MENAGGKRDTQWMFEVERWHPANKPSNSADSGILKGKRRMVVDGKMRGWKETRAKYLCRPQTHIHTHTHLNEYRYIFSLSNYYYYYYFALFLF